MSKYTLTANQHVKLAFLSSISWSQVDYVRANTWNSAYLSVILSKIHEYRQLELEFNCGLASRDAFASRISNLKAELNGLSLKGWKELVDGVNYDIRNSTH